MNGNTKIALFAIIALLMCGSLCRAQSVPPGTSADHERILITFLEAFNAGDRAGLTGFAATRLTEAARRGRPAAMVAQNDLAIRDQVGGGLDLVRIEKNSGADIVALTKGRGAFPHYTRVTLSFDVAHPGLIARRGVWETDPPADLMPPREAPAALAAKLDKILTGLTGEDRFSGAVMIAKDGKPLWQKAYGYADREAKAPNRLNTRFRLGSMNKMITSVAIAQLVQAGKLRFDETLAEALPDYPDREIAKKITLHHLLTHTSGLGDIFTPEFMQKKDSLHELKDYLPIFTHKPLLFEPGAGWSYSNAGFIVLGLIVEHASGRSYYDYVQKRIYDVAGMTSTGSSPTARITPHLAVGYMQEGPGAPWTPNTSTLPYRGMSAGGGDSTLADLLRFDQALRRHKFLSAALTDTILTGKVQPMPDPNRKYAYGFEETRASGHRIVGHGGGAPGMNAHLDMYLDNGMTVIVLANLDPPIATDVVDYIRLRLP